MKRPFSALSESGPSLAVRRHDKPEEHDGDATDITDVEEHSALEVELARGDEVLDSLKFVKKDRLRWLTQTSSADTIVNALDKCGLGGGDALSRKRRRYERADIRSATASASSLLKGKGTRRLPSIATRRRTLKMQEWTQTTLRDPLTKLKVFKEMKKGREMKKGKGKAGHSRNPSSSSDHSISDIENDILESDERMDLSDIEWYTRQTFDDDGEDKLEQDKGKRVADWDEDDEDDLDMSEVEHDVLASPMRVSSRSVSPAFQVPPTPIYSVAELNNVPACLYRPTADIIEEVYEHLGLDKTDYRGVRALKDLLDVKSAGMNKSKSSRYEVGSSGIFPNRPVAAKDWAALHLTRKIIRRDRLAKSAIYRFTFRYPKELVPGRFLRWQTWNHPTLAEIKQGLRIKLEERDDVEATQALVVPSSPAAGEEELDDDLDDVPEIEDLLSVSDELDEEEALNNPVDIAVAGESVIADEACELTDTDTETEIDDEESLAEDERLYEALGLTNLPEYESPVRNVPTTPRRSPIYSRLPRTRVDNDEPPMYAPRNYREQSPTPPPPFNAQTDNDIVIQPRFSPASLVPAVRSRLLPAFEMDIMPRRPISPLPSPERRARVNARTQRRVASGEIVIPGAFASRMTAPSTPVSVAVSSADAFEHALDMEEAETALDFLESPIHNSPGAADADGIIGWGASLVRSWWRR